MSETKTEEKKIEVTVPISIPQQRVSDLLSTALEGGSNYWYMIESFNYPAGQTKETLGIEFAHLELPFKGGSLTVSDRRGCEGSEQEVTTKVIDMAALGKGLEIMATKYPRHFADFIDENDDADTGDVFLQCCVFGELVYG